MSVIHVLSGIPPCPIVFMHRPSVSLLTMTFFESFSFAVWYGYFMARAFIELLILDPWEWAEAAEKKFALWPDQTRRQECLRSEDAGRSEREWKSFIDPFLSSIRWINRDRSDWIMASSFREGGDIALWLHNKLGSTDDTWSSHTISGQLNPKVLKNIRECFEALQVRNKGGSK